MRVLNYVASAAALALILSAASFAKDINNSGNFDLQQPAKVGSTVLQPGHYKAEWNGSNDAVKVNILQHGKTVATAEGHIKQLQAKSPYDAVSTRKQSDNSQKVDEIDFNNRSEALVFGGM
ncbi:MAG TPA: hypothetical protein VJQ54_00565 [Candidatus Sulfotelmatobacter sp.]|nr:hypothetical protein [Candidatus Sulfotelmatobacter sp.]